MLDQTVQKWRELQDMIHMVQKDRALLIHVVHETALLSENWRGLRGIDVHAMGVNAHKPSLCAVAEVTDIDFAVHADLVSQLLTAIASTASPTPCPNCFQLRRSFFRVNSRGVVASVPPD